MLLLLAFSLLGCTQDNGVMAVHNNEPQLSILHPVENAAFAARAPLSLTARASDDRTRLADLMVVWSSDQDDSLGGTDSVVDGELLIELPSGLDEGEHRLRLEVVDAEGASATDWVTVQAVPNAAPQVDILDPADGMALWPDQGVSLVASVADDFDPTEALLLVLSSDVDGVLDADVAYFGNTVEIKTTQSLSPTDHTLTLKAFDAGGLVGEASVSLVAQVNEAPRITSLTPADGEVFSDTPTLWVEVAIEDDALDLTELELEWFGLAEHSTCAGCTWPDAVESDGVRGFYLDLSGCVDGNVTRNFTVGLRVTDAEGLSDTVEHQIGLSCNL